MNIGHWIGGALGFLSGTGPLGIIAGGVLGGWIYRAMADGEPAGQQFYTDPARDTTTYSDEEQRNGFRFALLVLSAYVIQADGRIMHSEMELMRQFLRRNFGEPAVAEGEEILLRLFDQRKRIIDDRGAAAYNALITDSCQQLRRSISHEGVLQLVELLVEIARIDGQLDPREVDALRQLAGALGCTPRELDALLHLGEDDLEAAYKVFELDPSASDAEVRQAYRRLALKHHPDRVAALGEDVRRAAERKFQELGEAKERIYKARGLK